MRAVVGACCWVAIACAPEPSARPDAAPASLGIVQFDSPDAVTWTRQPGVVHPDYQALGLAVRPNGTLRLSGLKQGITPSLWEQFVSGPPARGLTYDGLEWKESTWAVSDSESVNFIDPQWLGDELWYVSRPGKSGDPALDGKDNRVRSAPPAQDRLVLANVTDPSPVRFGEALHLFVTVSAQGIHQYSGEPLREVRKFGNVTVPFAVVVGEELWLLGQRPLNGWRHPVVAKSRDGQVWSEFAPMLPAESVQHCTSPVMGPHPKGGWVLLCVEEPAR